MVCRLSFWILLLCSAAQSPGTAALPAAPADPRPNILLIVVDDLGYGELGCQGNPEIPTPNIDSLAENGIRFTAAYVSAPYCAPSRAGFITGRYPSRFGYDVNPVGARNLNPRLSLPTGERTIAQYLQAANYATGLVGKWHLGGTPAYHPLQRGFDEFYGFLHEGHFYAPPNSSYVTSFLRTNRLPQDTLGRWTHGSVVWSTHMGHNEPSYDTDNPILRGFDPIEEALFLTDALDREATSFISRHRDERWFLVLAYNAPHSPMQATRDWLSRFPAIPHLHRRVFAGMVAHLDASIGRVLRTLGRLDLEAETLIICFSDNGGPTRELTSSNAPLRGGKGQLWEGGIRIPFLIQWKDHLPAGRVFTHPIISLDILPTALTVAGAGVPDNVDGINLLPYLKGLQQSPPHPQLFWRYGRQAALRQGDWKWTRQVERGDHAPHLYNLAQDPAEQHDLADRYPDRVAAMQHGWEIFNAAQAPPIQ